MAHSLRVAACFAAIVLFAAGASYAAPKAATALPSVEIRVGEATLQIEVARTPEQQERGLMFREKLADNAGMLFPFAREEQATFWMKNTSLPLSIAFLNRAGRVLEIHDMQPFDETVLQSRSSRVAFALEVNQGWFGLNNVKEGDALQPVGATWDDLRFGPPVSIAAPPPASSP